jgi:4-diphosphocytidyl-2-C-methyl-D-erythritol kinase
VLELGARDTGLELELVKSIPSQAGLGGGSSDAAAAALAAWAALGEPCPRARLVEITGALGSDVAFFLEASETGYARCTGRGERVESLPSTGAARWTVALVVPAVASPTGEVYARFADEGRGAPPLSPRAPAPSVVATFFDGEESEVRAALANDLERAAEAAQPELARWRTLLDAVGAGHWRMCGSGSAFFGLYAGADEARADLARVEERAGAAGLTLRGSWATRPAGRGARLCAS